MKIELDNAIPASGDELLVGEITDIEEKTFDACNVTRAAGPVIANTTNEKDNDMKYKPTSTHYSRYMVAKADSALNGGKPFRVDDSDYTC